MAFGALKGTALTGNGNSVGASNALTGSVAVAVGDLVFVCFGQQTNLTATGASSTLVTTYTAQNVGTDAGVVTGRCFYGVVTSAGTLTQVDVAAASSTNDWCGLAAVIEGPFVASPADGNPANITSDVTSPFTCPLSGTLAQAHEVVIGWGAANQSTVWAATSPNLLAGNANNSTNVKVAIGYQKVIVTTSIAPVFSAAANPSAAVLGTISFKGDLQATAAITLAGLSKSNNTTVDISGTVTKTLGALTSSANATADIGATLSKTLGAVTLSASATVENPTTDSTLAATLGSATLSANAAVDVGATAGITLGVLTLSSAATVDISASANNTLGAIASSAAASVNDDASLSVFLGEATLSAAAGVADDATLAVTLGNLSSAANATVDVTASLAQTLGELVLSADATIGDTTDATLSQTLDALSATGAATVDIQAVLAQSLGAVTLSAAGSVDIDASLASTLGALYSAAALPGDCSVNATLGNLSATGYVTVHRLGGTLSGSPNSSGGGLTGRPAPSFDIPRLGQQSDGTTRANTQTGRRRP